MAAPRIAREGIFWDFWRDFCRAFPPPGGAAALERPPLPAGEDFPRNKSRWEKLLHLLPALRPSPRNPGGLPAAPPGSKPEGICAGKQRGWRGSRGKREQKEKGRE